MRAKARARTGSRAPMGARAAPMGARANEMPRAARGRTGTDTTPVVIRGAVSRDGTIDADGIRRRLGARLGKFAWRIDRVDVALSSKTPARGAAAAEITIAAKPSGADPVAVRATGASVRSAFLSALRAAEHSLHRWVEKMRRGAARAAFRRD